MAWKVGAAALLAMLLIPACGAVSRDKPAPATDSGTDASEEAGSEVDPDHCRLQGYGIGPVDSLQCDEFHLMAHALDACASSGGQLLEPHYVGAACEYQSTCCYDDGLPSIESLAAPSTGESFTLLFADAETSTRDLLLIAAEDACAAEQPVARLSDWVVYYAADGVTPLGLRYYCFSAEP
jgi:hypothetical protein